MFTCDRCNENFSQDGNHINHKKSCTGVRAQDPDKKICNICDKGISKKNFSRHFDTHNQRDPSQVNTVDTVTARVYKSARGPCPLCGVIVAKTNMSQQQKGSRCTGCAAFY